MLTASTPLERKPSRLSHINTVKRLFLQRHDTDALLLKPTLSHQSVLSDSSLPNHDNYRLTRIGTSDSACSQLSMQSKYRVTLDLSHKEISLLRYTWNRMLVEEPVEEETKLLLPFPGLAAINTWAQIKDKPLPSVASTRQALLASSTFCLQIYLNLLAMDPTLELAFPSLRHQAVLMAGVMSFAINSLENLSHLDAYLGELGKRHSRIFGIEPAQFELMGEAVVQTFCERFGTRFTHDLETLWIKFYLYLANSLLQFGLDPVLRLEDRAYLRMYPESVYTADLDSASMRNSARRLSQSTGATAATSIRPALDAEKKLNVAKPVPALVPHAAVTPEKKKRTRLGRKKGDCVIV